jgi:hypothetical protein
LREKFETYIVRSEESLIDVEIEGISQPAILRHMQCSKDIRPRGAKKNWMCFCANDRGVDEFPIDDMIGLGLLNGGEIYIGALTGDYLDQNVNPQRTGFIFEPDVGKDLRRQAIASSKVFLAEYIEKELKKKFQTAQSVIRQNPQFLYLSNQLQKFVSGLEASCSSEEQIYMAMALAKSRRRKEYVRIEKDISEATEIDAQIEEKIQEYKQYIAADQKGSLAEYVIKRKAVLDLLDTFSGLNADTDKDYIEDAVHSLICPMRTTSDRLDIEDHNLWIIDDRLAFCNFFASDKTLKSFTDSDSAREPDIALLYGSCFAWRESESATDTVILVEFKRPNKENYTDKTDPFMQLMDYVELFKSSRTVKDKDGKTISNVGANTAFHCYIVADLTQGLTRRLRGLLQLTPDKAGLFGYTQNPEAYVEVIPYQKLISDAQARNAIFFNKLGLGN